MKLWELDKNKVYACDQCRIPSLFFKKGDWYFKYDRWKKTDAITIYSYYDWETIEDLDFREVESNE